jgi:hypothetical protein
VWDSSTREATRMELYAVRANKSLDLRLLLAAISLLIPAFFCFCIARQHKRRANTPRSFRCLLSFRPRLSG